MFGAKLEGLVLALAVLLGGCTQTGDGEGGSPSGTPADEAAAPAERAAEGPPPAGVPPRPAPSRPALSGSSRSEDRAMSSLLSRGISQELARARSRTISDLSYRVDVALNRDAAVFEGRTVIRCTWRPEGDLPLVIDFAGKELLTVTRDGRALPHRVVEDHVVVEAADLVPGPIAIALEHRGGVGAAGEGLILSRDEDDGAAYVYTLNVPADGHAVFPCFDQPDLKGRYTLRVEAPVEWTVIANAPLSPAPDGDAPPFLGRPDRMVAMDRSVRAFSETEPISTYLFAFAAGPFVELKDEAPGRPLSFFGRKSQEKLLREHAPEVFRLHREALRFLEDWFAVPYPFAKLDFVCVPDFPFSGMEHPGCIFYGEQPLLFRSEVTRLQESQRADLIAHETAHMWFGDYVTMPWFDEVWLKEGFATYMAHKTLEATFPGIDHVRNFFLRNQPSALDTDVTSGAQAIRADLHNLASAKSAYGPIIYRKGPVVLRQLELLIGEEAFQRGVRAFLADHAYGSGDWRALRHALEDAWPGHGRDALAAWTRAWIESPGVPRVEARILREDGRSVVEVTQESLAGDGRLWPIAVEVAAYDLGGVVGTARITTDRARATAPIDLIGEPRLLFANQGAGAYALFRLDPESRAFLFENFGRLDDGLLRALLWQSLWTDVLEGEIDPRAFVELALREVFFEDDQRVLQTVLGRCAHAVAHLFPAADRGGDALVRQCEVKLRNIAFDGAHDRGARLIAFRALGDFGYSEPARRLLRELVAGETAPPGLAVALRDRWDFLIRLMLVGDEQAEALLARMVEADPSEDGRRQAFLVACARPDAARKAELFRRFFEDADLPERWVQNGAPIFFSTLQAELTDPYLAPALERLDWIKHNRKIFFLADWVNAAIRSRRTEAAVRTVQAYLARPDTEADVASKVRVALDHLVLSNRARAAWPR